MNLLQYLNARALPLVLMAVMLLTRFLYFGDALHLPDASLAMFYFAGYYPPYLSYTLIYSVIGLGLIKLVNAIAWFKPERKPAQLVITISLKWVPK
jgi:hypothetical protein